MDATTAPVVTGDLVRDVEHALANHLDPERWNKALTFGFCESFARSLNISERHPCVAVLMTLAGHADISTYREAIAWAARLASACPATPEGRTLRRLALAYPRFRFGVRARRAYAATTAPARPAEKRCLFCRQQRPACSCNDKQQPRRWVERRRRTGPDFGQRLADGFRMLDRD